MPTLLHVDVSPMGEGSVSRHLTAEFVKDWRAAHADGKVIERDLSTSELPALNANWVGAAYTPEDKRSVAQKDVLTISDKLVGELLEADHYVFGVPMWNFGVPSSMKAWIDQIVRVGITFSYAGGAPKGLIEGKKATVLIASGGHYELGSPTGQYNFVEPYLRAIFGWLGITDVTFITAGGTAALMQGAKMETLIAPKIAEVDALFGK